MEERNEFLESDGLVFESETHEWFRDKSLTDYARKPSILWGSGEQKEGLSVFCFVVRNKSTGEYDRVVMEEGTNEIVYDTKNLEALGFWIDQQKLLKRFE